MLTKQAYFYPRIRLDHFYHNLYLFTLRSSSSVFLCSYSVLQEQMRGSFIPNQSKKYEHCFQRSETKNKIERGGDDIEVKEEIFNILNTRIHPQ